MSWRTVKLGEVLTHRKGFITISDSEKYKLCRVQLHRKGVLLREIVSGATIRTKKQQLCKANDFIVAEMDAKVGGYGFIPNELEGAIVSSHYYLFEVNENLLKKDFLAVLNKTQTLQNQIKATGSTNYASVRPSDVLAWEIPLPPIEEQERIIEKIQTVEINKTQISTELNHQLALVKGLRQAYLREAMQGKLTRQDSTDEPAEILLEKIKAEKEKLITEKKIKREKPLPPIKPEEVPSEIPASWIWCRVGEVAKVKVGSTPSRQNPSFWGGDINWVSSGEVANNYIYSTKEKITESALQNTSLTVYPVGSVLVAMIGQGKTRGQASILKIPATTNQNVAGLIIEHGFLTSEFLWFFFLSRYEITRGDASGGNQPALNGIKISNTLFQLPPLAEQGRIVAKLEKLLGFCDELEANIKQGIASADDLLQTALKEALEPEGTRV